MLRRQARERREYLYRKALEEQDRATQSRKRKLKDALEDGKQIPQELREDAVKLHREIELDDDLTAELKTHEDDEYAHAGTRDPKIMITTSRDPSSKLKQFTKEFKLLFPNAQRMNRGGTIVKELVEACRTNDVTDLLILSEHRGQPDGLIVCHLPHGPTAYFTLANVVMRHDVPQMQRSTVSEAFPHLIFDNFSTKLGERMRNILRYLYPVPREDTSRVMTYANEGDYISFRHHTFVKKGKDVELTEVGPRFEMRPYQILLGTLDMADTCDREWVHRPYMHTAFKRQHLSDK